MIAAKDWEILSFFSVEPALLDANVPWCYNSATYDSTIGEFRVSCTIQPASHGIELTIHRKNRSVLELNASDAKDVQYKDDADGEALVVELSEGFTIELVLRPEVQVRQSLHVEPCFMNLAMGMS